MTNDTKPVARATGANESQSAAPSQDLERAEAKIDQLRSELATLRQERDALKLQENNWKDWQQITERQQGTIEQLTERVEELEAGLRRIAESCTNAGLASNVITAWVKREAERLLDGGSADAVKDGGQG